MLVWGIILALLISFGFVRLRVSFRHDPGETRLTIGFGFFRMRVLPAKERGKRPQKPEKKRKREKKPLFSGLVEKFTLQDIGPLMELAGDLMKKSARGVRFDRVEADYAIGGRKDPCQAAIAYGCWMAGIGTLLPIADEKLRIKRFRIHITPDFAREDSAFRARLDASLSVGRGIGLSIYLLIKGIKFVRKTNEEERRFEKWTAKSMTW